MINNDQDPVSCSVALLNQGYNEERNIASVARFGINLVHCSDRIHLLRKLWHRMSGVGYTKLLHSFSWPAGTGGAVVHTFNGIVIPKMSWVVSFETTLPRDNSLPRFIIRRSWKKLAASECLRILALSESARNRLLSDLSSNRGGISEKELQCIRAKLEVLHPPQNVLVSFEEKERVIGFGGPLRLAIVGHDFYRKGGLELLQALDQLLDEGREIELNVAGAMWAGDYASKAGPSEEKLARSIVEKHSKSIRLLGSITGLEVLDLFKRSHIVCLPTWGETYGYSVLEGQASGCPAITTDLRALPEINDVGCGWVVQVPKLANGDSDLGTFEKREEFRNVLVKGLLKALQQADDDRVLLRCKAAASIARIQDNHDPAHHANRLRIIYQTLGCSKK